MNAILIPTKTDTARILVVEDHIVVREGLVALINREPALHVCAEADTIETALLAMDRHRPDLMILDLILKGGSGMDLIKQCRQRYPKTAILVISMQDEEVFAERCIKAGAGGYIMKHAATDTFLDAIRYVLAGEIYISPALNARMLKRLAHSHVTPGKPDVESLSDRELQIFQMIGSGMTAREIAPQLGISPKTVATHRENLKAKLGMKDGRTLLQFAMRWADRPNAS